MLATSFMCVGSDAPRQTFTSPEQIPCSDIDGFTLLSAELFLRERIGIPHPASRPGGVTHRPIGRICTADLPVRVDYEGRMEVASIQWACTVPREAVEELVLRRPSPATFGVHVVNAERLQIEFTTSGGTPTARERYAEALRALADEIEGTACRADDTHCGDLKLDGRRLGQCLRDGEPVGR